MENSRYQIKQQKSCTDSITLNLGSSDDHAGDADAGWFAKNENHLERQLACRPAGT